LGNRQADITDQMIKIEGGPFISGLTAQQIHEMAKQYAIREDLFHTQSYKQIDLPSYYIDKNLVTNQQYKTFTDDTGYRPPLPWVDRGYPAWLEHGPVTGVNHEDAKVYARWAGKRMVKAAEWEKAARGVAGRLWPWGNHWRTGVCKMDDGISSALPGFPAPVGSFKEDCSEYGVMDMAGNVSEWVDDGLTMMGGNFTFSAPYQFLCANRTLHPQLNGYVGYIGFRCAYSHGEPEQESGQQVSGDHPGAVPLQLRYLRRKSTDVETKNIEPTLTSIDQCPIVPVAPVKSRYRSDPIQLLPIRDLDPTKKVYPYSMDAYLPSQIMAKDDDDLISNGIPILACRIEVTVPYLPTDRFCLWLENYDKNRERPREDQFQPRFSQDHTMAKFVKSAPGEVEARIEIRGGRDFVDVEHQVSNTSCKVMPISQDLCFQSLNAPCFRDHDGNRTFIMTDQGFRRITQVDHSKRPRLWFQPFVLPESTFQPKGQQQDTTRGGPVVTGPLIATVSRDGQWVVGPTILTGPVVRMLNNREYSCLHCDSESRLEPDQTIRIVQRIYFLRGGLDDLVSRWQSDKESWE